MKHQASKGFALSSKNGSDMLTSVKKKSLQSNYCFPQQEQRDTKTAKPQEDVWHFHDLSKDNSVATIPEDNRYKNRKYITQKIALCAMCWVTKQKSKYQQA